MLQINLLPLEKRRKERTPLPRFLVIISAAVIVILLLLWNIKIIVSTKQEEGQLAECDKKLNSMQEKLAGLSKLQDEEKQLLSWKQTAETVSALRVFKWWYVIDDLLYVFEGFPTIWIGTFGGKDSSAGGGTKSAVEASLSFDCHGLGNDPKLMTDFRNKLALDSPEITGEKGVFNLGITNPPGFDTGGAETIPSINFRIILERERRAVSK